MKRFVNKNIFAGDSGELCVTFSHKEIFDGNESIIDTVGWLYEIR